ncbi:MAG: Maf family protein [Eubacteriales bacterium]|nr:Maf family protein [Eubacteriales bacterium]
MKIKKIILASASPRRQELLRQIGLEFSVLPSQKEEKSGALDVATLVEELSAHKAFDVREKAGVGADPETLVIGADTVVCREGEVLGKPRDREDARRMLSLLQGRSHQVYTGVTLCRGEESFSFSVCTQVEFYPMSREEIEDYIATGEPMDKAGAYGIQGRGAAFVKGITGDYNNVVGLPVARLYQELSRRGLL